MIYSLLLVGSSTPDRTPPTDTKPIDVATSSDDPGGSSDELVIIMDGVDENDSVAMETSSAGSEDDTPSSSTASSTSTLSSTSTNHTDSKKLNKVNKKRKTSNNNVLPPSEQPNPATTNANSVFQRTDSVISDIDINAFNGNLRKKVIREVRKPGKSKYKPIDRFINIFKFMDVSSCETN